MPKVDSPEGKEFSPFWHPTSAELQYCAELSKWWKAVEEERKEKQGPVTMIEAAPVLGRTTKKREHRLIRDAGPEVPPQGFFDCTVEVRFVSVTLQVRGLDYNLVCI